MKKIIFKNELYHFHPLHPTTSFLDSFTTLFVKREQPELGTADSGSRFREDKLKKPRGQGDKKRASFKRQEKWCRDRESIEVPGRGL